MTWFQNKKAIVPVDFGPESRWAVDTALEIVGDPTEVNVIHVGTDINELAPIATWDLYNEDAIREHLEKEYREHFADSKYRDLPFTLRFGDPGHHIADFAKEIGADLIVMPSHGRRGLSHLLIGSVAERVVRLAHCPVLILRR